MLFNSYEFILFFLPVCLFFYYYLLNKKFYKLSKVHLVCSSLFFYSWWNIHYLPLLLISILFNFYINHQITKKNLNHFQRKRILIFAIIVNISLLAYFKYSDFFIANINLIFGLQLPLLDLVLPLAISFFTFQQIAYLIDSYSTERKENNFLNYTTFVTFFPQLIAGPIVYYKEMMPQFKNLKKTKKSNYIALGLFLFSIGLFKKVIIADTFALWATSGFDKSSILTFFEAWATSLSYTFQLYFDFSGYTDMAIGLALLFNINLPANFNSPYKATNIQDFWQRWHITLSRFLKDHIYIPLGGNRYGNYKTINNILITFTIGGIWHGAGWTFIFWGLLHGLALVVNRIWKSLGMILPIWLSWFLTFNFVNVAWIFFRSNNWEDAIKVLKGMVGLSGVILPSFLSEHLSFLGNYGVVFGGLIENISDNKFIPLWIFFSFIFVLSFNNSMEIKKNFSMNYKTSIFAGITFVCSFLSINRVSEFLYFNF
tara:strand:- start:236 stop:1690 length:1455 start_codon:yes stop_codon:yes gene_type:complete